MRNFKSIVAAVEHIGGVMFSDELLVNIGEQKDVDAGRTTKDEKHYKSIVRVKIPGVAFLKRADQQEYGRLMTSIRDQHSFKNDVYPKTLHKAYTLLETHSLSKVNMNTDQRNYNVRGGGARGYGCREGR